MTLDQDAPGQRPLRVLWIAPSVEPLDGAVDHLVACGVPRDKIGVLYRDRPTNPEAPFQVASEATLDRRNKPGADLVISDEAHHDPAPRRRRILDGLRFGEVDVVSSVGVLSQAVDLPEVKCVVMARPTRSLRLFIQQGSRCMTPWAGVRPRILLTLANRESHAYVTPMHDPPRFDDLHAPETGRVCGSADVEPPLFTEIAAVVVALRALAIAVETPLSGTLDRLRREAVTAFDALRVALGPRITRYDAADQRSRLRSCIESVTAEWLNEKADGWEAYRETLRRPRP